VVKTNHACVLCDISFATAGKLRKHIKAFHMP
jgi:hypothetical protein